MIFPCGAKQYRQHRPGSLSRRGCLNRRRCLSRQGCLNRRGCLTLAAALLIAAWGPNETYAASPAAASPIAATAQLTAQASASSVQVAEPFWLELTVTAPAGSQVTFPAAGHPIGPFEIIDTVTTPDVPGDQAPSIRSWTRRWQLESLVAGRQQVPALEIRVLVPGHAEPQVLRSDPIDVRVTSVLEDRADPRQFRDIESVVDVTVPTSTPAVWPWWAAAGSALVAVAAVGLLMVRRRRTLTPAQWALQRIAALQLAVQSGQCNSTGPLNSTGSFDSDAVLRELSAVLYDYLRTDPSSTQTAGTLEELIRAAEQRGEIDPAAAGRILEAWSLADKAKFAGWQLSSEQLQSVIAETGHWIETQAERG